MTLVTVNFRLEGFSPFYRGGYGPVNNLDFSKILSLPEDEFAQRYLGEMTRYFYEHANQMLRMEETEIKMGLSPGLRLIKCTDCRGVIESAKDLRRYCGNSLHPDCFSGRWKKDRRSDGKPINNVVVRYLDRVAELKFE